jgi:hypothetical protein
MKFLPLILLLLSCSPKTPEVSKICSEGHEYFKYQGQIAIRLTDEGKPIKCGNSSAKTDLDQEFVKIALDWINLVEEKKFDKSWELAAPFFKNALTKKDWTSAATMVDKQLGKNLKREPFETNIRENRAEIKFKSDFEKLSGMVETLSLIKIDGKWLVIGFIVK